MISLKTTKSSTACNFSCEAERLIARDVEIEFEIGISFVNKGIETCLDSLRHLYIRPKRLFYKFAQIALGQ